MMSVTVLSGASRGLGNALLDELMHLNEPVIVIGRSTPDRPSDLIAYIEADLAHAGGQAATSEGLSRLLAEHLARRTFSQLTFINNAGIVKPIGLVGSLPMDELLASIAVNFAAPVVIANACLQWTNARGIASRIINISSGAASRPLAGWSAYCSSKAAARMFFDVQALEGLSSVIHIDPGVMDTGMQGDIRNADKERFPQGDAFRDLKKDGKLASPSDVARAIVAAHYGAQARARALT
jgi:benzil reductase ((S)-benzoin forming)